MMNSHEERMLKLLGEEWFQYLKDDINSTYFNEIGSFISTERFRTTVYPMKDDVFTAYKLCQPANTKVIIIDTEPHLNKGEAHGLAFSVKDEILKTPPSLKHIQNSIEQSVYNGLNLEWTNDLTRWAEQGIFLLNTILTVEKSKSLSHSHLGWQQFTKKSIEIIDLILNNCVFLLFGKEAQKFCNISDKHLVINCEHPAAASYQKRDWIFNDCWNQTNEYLIKHNKIPIIW